MASRRWRRAPPSRDRRALFPAFLLPSFQIVLTVRKDHFPAASAPSFRGSRASWGSQIQSALPLQRPTNHRQQTEATDQRIASPTESADLTFLTPGSSRQYREVTIAKTSACAVQLLPYLGSDPLRARRGIPHQAPQQFERLRVACAVPSCVEG